MVPGTYSGTFSCKKGSNRFSVKNKRFGTYKKGSNTNAAEDEADAEPEPEAEPEDSVFFRPLAQ